MFASNFEQEEKGFKNRKTLVSLFVTLSVHALILLALFLVILHTPDPPYEDSAGGMAINFGFDEAGTGDVQALSENPGPMENNPAPAAAASQVENTPEEQLTEEDAETEVVAPKVEEKPKPKPKPNPETTFKPTPKPANTTNTSNAKTTNTNNTPPAPSADPNAMFTKGAYGKPNNSKGDGTGGGQGDQGKPNGDPNSKNYLGDGGFGDSPGGGGLGNGGFSLAGRKKTAIPDPVKCSTAGKVVITIKVNKEGKVVDAVFKRFASTTFDDCNVNNALNAARKATFNADANAPDIQEGTITYVYQVK